MQFGRWEIVTATEERANPPVYLDKSYAYFWGVPIYKQFSCGADSVFHILEDCTNNVLDFNQMWGGFRIVLNDERNNKKLFFCDNSGNCCFFVDVFSKRISAVLVDLKKNRQEMDPNYRSISQLLTFNCIYGYETLVKGITRTNPNCSYEIDDNNITTNPKNLIPLEKLNTFDTMGSLMERIVSAVKNEKTVAIITGGNDSRCVLAHLEYLRATFDLTISGKSDNIDVKIGRQIANVLNRTIHISSGIPDGDNWVDESFIASDGLTGAFGRYRLLQNAMMLNSLGYNLVLGGVGGESYKNSFINQDFPFYKGNEPNLSRFYDMKVETFAYPDEFVGSQIIAPINDMKSWMVSLLERQLHNTKSKYQAYNQMGYFLLQERMVSLNNYTSNFVNVIQPLMERDCVALAYNLNPQKAGMQFFQRKEISTYCPQIKDILTDRGLTCNSSASIMRKEAFRDMLYLLKFGLKRKFKKTIPAAKKNDRCIEEGKLSPQFKQAVLKCKELGVLHQHADIYNLPDHLSDRLMTIGTFFMHSENP